MIGLKKFARAPVVVAGIISVLALTGCKTTETIYIQHALPIPDRPVLPTIPPEDLECLSDSAYENLAVRDTLLQEHIKRLEAIMLTTHPEPGKE